MTDLLHTHLELGMKPGCPACLQVEDSFEPKVIPELLALVREVQTSV